MKPKVIAIAGGSGSGKTTFAKMAIAHYGPEKCCLVAQDNYYIDQSHRFDKDGGSVNFDHPSSLDFDLMASHVSSLKKGLAVEVPLYDFATHSRLKKTKKVEPRPLIIVEGILILQNKVLREQFDQSYFIECPEKLRFERRLHRDTTERGRTVEGVKEQFFNQVKPMHDQFVEPSKEYATFVLEQQDYLANSERYILDFDRV